MTICNYFNRLVTERVYFWYAIYNVLLLEQITAESRQ